MSISLTGSSSKRQRKIRDFYHNNNNHSTNSNSSTRFRRYCCCWCCGCSLPPLRCLIFGIPFIVSIVLNLPLLYQYYDHQQRYLPSFVDLQSSFETLPTTIKDNVASVIDVMMSKKSSLSSTSSTITKKNVTVVVCKEDMELEIGLVYRSLLPYLFPSKFYETRIIETDKAVLPPSSPSSSSSIDIDILLCLGYFYPQNYTKTKQEIGDRLGYLSTDHGRNITHHLKDVYWPPPENGDKHRRHYIVPHREKRPFQFAFQSEAWDRGDCRYDLMIVSTDPTRNMFRNCPLYFWPYYASSFFRRSQWQTHLLPKLEKAPIRNPTRQASNHIHNKSKSDFCAFVVGACWHDKYVNNDIMIRPIFYDLLSERIRNMNHMNNTTVSSSPTRTKSNANQTLNLKDGRLTPSKMEGKETNKDEVVIKSFGRCRNTEGTKALRPKYSDRGFRDTDDIVAVYQPFRFAIVFENNAVRGYVTEKITNALLADTIPIYWGAPDIAKYVNLDRIVHCGELEGSPGLKEFRTLPRPKNIQDAESIIQTQGRQILHDAFQSCIDDVIELENNPEKYLWKLSQPILPGDGKIEGSYFDLDKIGRDMRTVISAFDSPLVPLDDPSLTKR